MGKHTEGPWVVTEENREVEAGVFYVAEIQPAGTYRGEVCRVQDAHHIGGIDAGEAQANARLIAAAPDLLRAIECLLEMGHAKAGDLALAAIAKAKGEQA